jgi:HD-GYP domain-containing protein (c-di-GMP phosphodiesterase class II)
MMKIVETSQANSAASVIQAAKAAEACGSWDDAVRMYREAADLLSQQDPDKQAAKVLRWLGRVYFERGEHERAADAFERSLVAARALGVPEDAAGALNGMAVTAQFRGRLELAEQLYESAARLCEEVGDLQLAAIIGQNLGTLANTRGDLPTALVHYDFALKHFRKLDDSRGAAWVLNNMGMLHIDVEEWAAAELCFKSAEMHARKINDNAIVGKIAINRAELYLKKQNFEQARQCCDQAFEIFSQLASHTGLGEAHKYYGILYRETGKAKVAHLQFSLALELARSCENPLLEAETESERARAFLNECAYQSALQSLNRAYSLFGDLDARREIMDLGQRLEKLEESYFRAVQLWADQQTTRPAEDRAQRGRRVADLGVRLARAVNYPNLTALRLGCFLRDLGNAAVPHELLHRAGPISAEERELVHTHVQRGEQLLAELGFAEEIRAIVRYHHERWDGKGYPDGLAGNDIPLGARIVAIVDVFDALTANRSWREAFSAQEALTLLQQDAGKAFDPELLEKFLGLLNQDNNAKTTLPSNRAVSA